MMVICRDWCGRVGNYEELGGIVDNGEEWWGLLGIVGNVGKGGE